MNYDLDFRPYQVPFSKPLVTNHGSWKVREGIIIRLTEALGQVSYGEIAPIPWFGSETLAEALQFCQGLPKKLSLEEINTIPDRLPATQFAFSSSLEVLKAPLLQENLERSPFTLPTLNPHSTYSYLLPTGIAAIDSWQTPWQQGYRTFKQKIGVDHPHQELDQIQQLVNLLPEGAKLRLDANGGIDFTTTKLWLEECDRLKIKHPVNTKKVAIPPNPPSKRGRLDFPSKEGFIEFLEQPLPVENFRDLLTLADKYETAIALDESVATLRQLETCYSQGWRGIFVIKPSIAGFSDRLREFCHHNTIDAVFSSSLETAIGRDHALKLAMELSNPHRALGFGVDHWLKINQETLIRQLWQ